VLSSLLSSSLFFIVVAIHRRCSSSSLFFIVVVLFLRRREIVKALSPSLLFVVVSHHCHRHHSLCRHRETSHSLFVDGVVARCVLVVVNVIGIVAIVTLSLFVCGSCHCVLKATGEVNVWLDRCAEPDF